MLLMSCGGKKDGSANENASGSAKTEKKTKDQEMSEKLVGAYLVESENERDVTIEYFKDGKFLQKGTADDFDSEGNMFEINYELLGSWKIENGYLKSIIEKAKTDDGTDQETLKERVKEMNKKSTADKVIEINDQKFVYDNADGDRKILKRKVQ
jgi:hypothetical protein